MNEEKTKKTKVLFVVCVCGYGIVWSGWVVIVLLDFRIVKCRGLLVKEIKNLESFVFPQIKTKY